MNKCCSYFLKMTVCSGLTSKTKHLFLDLKFYCYLKEKVLSLYMFLNFHNKEIQDILSKNYFSHKIFLSGAFRDTIYRIKMFF